MIGKFPNLERNASSVISASCVSSLFMDFVIIEISIFTVFSYSHLTNYTYWCGVCQQNFIIYPQLEKSSNKCKTLLAKHHFIILHNSVCVLLVNLHRLPLFSFCSLLILLYLCQSCQFFLEQFAGGFPSEHLPWVVVDPVLYPLDIVLCPVIEVFSLWYLPAYQSVLVLVAATLK